MCLSRLALSLILDQLMSWRGEYFVAVWGDMLIEKGPNTNPKTSEENSATFVTSMILNLLAVLTGSAFLSHPLSVTPQLPAPLAIFSLNWFIPLPLSWHPQVFGQDAGGSVRHTSGARGHDAAKTWDLSVVPQTRFWDESQVEGIGRRGGWHGNSRRVEALRRIGSSHGRRQI